MNKEQFINYRGISITSFSQRLFKTPFYRPLCKKSSSQSLWRKAEYFFPPKERMSLTFIGNESIRTSIPALFSSGRPTAILLTIVFIVINSLKCCLFFSKFLYMRLVGSIHIISELFKRVPKAFNSATAITVICMKIRILTSFFCTNKTSVKSQFCLSFAESMNLISHHLILA